MIRKHAALLPLVVFTMSCHSTSSSLQGSPSSPSVAPPKQEDTPVRIDGGNGLACQNAVVIHAPSDHDAVEAAFEWLGEHYPGYRYVGAALTPTVAERGQKGGKGYVYDTFSIELPNGERIGICFDITESWGK